MTDENFATRKCFPDKIKKREMCMFNEDAINISSDLFTIVQDGNGLFIYKPL